MLQKVNSKMEYPIKIIIKLITIIASKSAIEKVRSSSKGFALPNKNNY